ncbi:MAG: hypothetical protein ACLFRL_08510 [Desulfohalobiaceae bacterium]
MRRILVFLKAAALPSMVFILALSLGCLILQKKIQLYILQQYSLCILLAASKLLLMFLLLTSGLDALNRYREFKRMKALFLRYGFQPRLFAALSGSRCQRDAIRAAACESGFAQHIASYFRNQGYRWYHILPNGLRGDPLYVLRPEFLRSFFRLRRGSTCKLPDPVRNPGKIAQLPRKDSQTAQCNIQV